MRHGFICCSSTSHEFLVESYTKWRVTCGRGVELISIEREGKRGKKEKAKPTGSTEMLTGLERRKQTVTFNLDLHIAEMDKGCWR